MKKSNQSLVPVTPKVGGTRYAAVVYDDSIYPISVLIEMQSYADDDIRVRIDGVTVSDTQWNVGWYKRDTLISKTVTQPFWQADYFRAVTITYAQAEAAGVKMRREMLVEVDTFDGWASGWRSGTWVATITWNDGYVGVHNGGSLVIGTSSGVNPLPPPNPFSYGPHFLSYYPNGSCSAKHGAVNTIALGGRGTPFKGSVAITPKVLVGRFSSVTFDDAP